MRATTRIGYGGSLALLLVTFSCGSDRVFSPTGDEAAGGQPVDAGASGKGGGAGSNQDPGGGSSGDAGAAGAGDALDCSPEQKECNGTCVSSTDPAYGCGASTCDSSACPNPGAGGTVICKDGACVIDQCPATFKKCGDRCVSIGDPNFGCGESGCDASTCPAPGTSTLVCDGGACVVGNCGAETKKCGNKCVPTDVNNGCSDPARCTPCAGNEACGGASNTCQCVPIAQAVACNGKCGAVANGCGGMHDCGGCTSPQTCGGGGVTSVCGCTPTSKANACGANNCGTAANGCGDVYQCGSCGSGAPVCVSGKCKECATKNDCAASFFDCVGGACACAPQTSVNLLTNAGFNDSLQGWTAASGAKWASADSDECPRSGSVSLAGGNITQCVRNVTGGKNYTVGFRFLSASDTPLGCFGSFYTDTDCKNAIGPDFINVSGGGTGSPFWEPSSAFAPAPAGTKSIQVNCFTNGGSGVGSMDQLYLSVGSGPSPSAHF
jgi:hypothetical protein